MTELLFNEKNCRPNVHQNRLEFRLSGICVSERRCGVTSIPLSYIAVQQKESPVWHGGFSLRSAQQSRHLLF